MELQGALGDFLSYLVVQRRASPHTLRAYETDLKHWISDLEIRHGITSLESLSDQLEVATVRSYLAGIHDSLERSSLCRRLSSIRSFLRYLRHQKRIKRDVGILVPSPKAKPDLP